MTRIPGSEVLQRLAILVLAASTAGLAACGSTRSAATEKPVPERNAVTDWASIVQPSIHNSSEPRPPTSSEVLHTIVQLAVYDAVVAIEGGYEPYTTAIDAPGGADINAAVATSAYRAARGRVASSQFAYLDGEYSAYMAKIPDGRAKTDGVGVGEAAAAGILALRADDGFSNAVAYQCSASPPPAGEFEPNGGCGTEPVDAKIAQVKPFTFRDPAQFRPDGPDPFTSDRWVEDFDEVKAYGGTDSSVRTAEQTDLVYFWSEHAYAHWNRNLIGLAVARRLDVPETARLFAMAHTAASDAAIAGFEAKYSYRTWRPRTAIPRAADDGNPRTAPDSTWTPLLTVNHPEYPSGHAFFSTALTEAVATFFGTHDVEWTIVTSKDAVPQLVQTQRTYKSLKALTDDVDNARVWAGLHYRNSMHEGDALGRQIAEHVMGGYFRPRHEGRLLIDGSVVNPLPASVLRNAGIRCVIGSTVAGRKVEGTSAPSTGKPHMLQVVSSVIASAEAEMVRRGEALVDVLVRPQVSASSTFDFGRIEEFVAEGERAAREALAGVEKMPAGAGAALHLIRQRTRLA